MNLSFEQVVTHLRKIKADHGDESFHQALKGLFRTLLTKPGADEYIERLLQEFSCPVNLDEFKAEVQASTPKGVDPGTAVDMIRRSIEQQMPHCKTQAHFDLVLQAWEALKVYLEASYALDPQAMQQARAGLNQLLELAPQVARAHVRLQETPEATSNPDYLEPARELTEHSKQQTLMADLQGIDSPERLQAWYANAKPTLDSIVTPALRNEILDAIRAKKNALTN